MWDVPLDKLRSSRLLALRMHVARYVVRTGAQQRSAIAFLSADALDRRGPLLLELLEAAGTLNPQVMAWPESAEAALPLADVLLFGASGETTDALAERMRSRDLSSAVGGPQIWTFSVEELLREPGPQIVEAVETFIRIVMPEALGANGTPPTTDLAVRIR